MNKKEHDMLVGVLHTESITFRARKFVCTIHQACRTHCSVKSTSDTLLLLFFVGFWCTAIFFHLHELLYPIHQRILGNTGKMNPGWDVGLLQGTNHTLVLL